MNEMMIDTTGSQWREIYDIEKIDFEDGIGSIKLYIEELTGTKTDVGSRMEGERSDMTVFVPIIYIELNDNSDAYKILKNEGLEYNSDKVPSCNLLSRTLELIINQDKVVVRYRENVEPIINININFYTYEVIKNLQNITLFVVDKDTALVSSIPVEDNKEEFSQFPYVQKMSVFGKGLDLKKLVPNINKFEQSNVFKPDYMQDVQKGTSDYYYYESTSKKESLPTSKSITYKRCFACGRDETSKEHCSPKWIAVKYNVKPLVANVFCIDCNNWFGVNLENKMQQLQKNNYISNAVLINWCIKTSLTMSIASGVPLNTDDLRKLRLGKTPAGYEVYYVNFGINTNGFSFGVSHFETQIRKRGTFLFTFTMPDFSIVVLKNKEGVLLDIPFNKIWPQGENQIINIPSTLNITDLHQRLHEDLSKQKTEDVELKFRPQK
ncbi:hypothetical protein Q7W32_07805 [Streptococcus suis]|nr:hypothetical protein [Streptococcus suis]